jgi:hypothetical protein
MKAIYLALFYCTVITLGAQAQTIVKLEKTDLEKKEYLGVYLMYGSKYHLESLNSFKKSVNKLYTKAKRLREKKRSKVAVVEKWQYKIESYLDKFILLQSKQFALVNKLDTLTKLLVKLGFSPEDTQRTEIIFPNIENMMETNVEIMTIFSKLLDLFPEKSEETQYKPTMITLHNRRVFLLRYQHYRYYRPF